jgi:glycosyltransferase
MKTKELYIFNGASRAAVYGIGTYMEQLIKALKDTEWKLNMVYLYAQGNEIEITEKDGYRQINIPFPSKNHPHAQQYYSMIITYLLKDIITCDKKTEYLFHLNFMTNSYFVKCLKKHFSCKVILVSHYTDWSFSLFGDVRKLKRLLQKSKKTLMDALEKQIVEGFHEDLKMIKQVDRLVCVAQHTWDVFHSIGAIPSGKTEIIHNALEDIYIPMSEKEKLLLRKKYHIDENIKVILFAGRLDEVKGIAYLIRAFRKVLHTYPNSILLIAGDGNFNAWLKEADNYWTKITFTGKLDKKQLYELYHLADIGVICSLHEEFGLVALEMMMHALPVIVTKTGGLDEIIEDNVSGLKVPVKTVKGKRQVDVRCLSEKMLLLLENPVLAKELGSNGRKRFMEKFELSVFKEKMLKLYQNI